MKTHKHDPQSNTDSELSDDKEMNAMITLLQTAQPTLGQGARRRIWERALSHTTARSHDWFGRLPLTLAAAGLLIFSVLLAVRPLLTAPVQGASTGTSTVTAMPGVAKDTLTSFRAVVRTRIGSIPMYTYLWYEAPDLYRSEGYETNAIGIQAPDQATLLTAPPVLDGFEFSLTRLNLSDKTHHWTFQGRDVYLWTPQLFTYPGYYLQREIVTGRGQAALDQLLKHYSTKTQQAKLIGEETLLGRKVWVIDGFLPGLKPQGTIKLWIDQTDFFRLKTMSYVEPSTAANGSMSTTELIELETNVHFDPSIFTLNLPTGVWRAAFKQRNGDKNFSNTNSWTQFQPQIPMSIFGPILPEALQDQLMLSPLSYDPLEATATAYAYSADDPMGAPVLTITQTHNTNKSALVDGDGQGLPAAYVANDYGYVRDDGKRYIFALTLSGTYVTLTADMKAMTKAEFTAIAKSLVYVRPGVDPYAYIAVWEQAARTAPYKVYAPGYGLWVTFSEPSVIQNWNLGWPIDQSHIVSGQPIMTNNTVIQPFHFDDKPGVSILLTEGRFDGDYSDWEPNKMGDYPESYYKVDGDRQTLVILIEGTTIKLEAKTANVQKSDLIRIGSYLRPVTPKAAK